MPFLLKHSVCYTDSWVQETFAAGGSALRFEHLRFHILSMWMYMRMRVYVWNSLYPFHIHRTEISEKKNYTRVTLSEVKQLLSIGGLTYGKKTYTNCFLGTYFRSFQVFLMQNSPRRTNLNYACVCRLALSLKPLSSKYLLFGTNSELT